MFMVFPLGKLVSWYSSLGETAGCMRLLPAMGEGGLHDYSPLWERVGCMVTPTGGEGGLLGYSLLGGRVNYL